jgi:hypothetical protein
MWRVQSPMKHRSVGGVIVLGGRESRLQGEGRSNAHFEIMAGSGATEISSPWSMKSSR